MKNLLIISSLLLGTFSFSFGQKDTPAIVYMTSGESIDVKHFGQLKCSNTSVFDSYIIIRGKLMGNVTEIRDYNDIEKIVLNGYSKPPMASVGNEKGTLKIYKRDGVVVILTEAELAKSCYGAGDKYNQLSFQILNPLTNKTGEATVDTKDIQSIVFK